MSKKAIIIGAGPAGLTAAYYLLKQTDIIPIILEESGEIGGISRTAQYKGNRIDIGGHRFFSKNDDVMKLWQTLMPLQGAASIDDKKLKREKPMAQGGPDPEQEDRVMLMRTRISRIFYLRKFFDYPISFKLETFANMGLWRTLQAGFGYMWSAIFKREEKSLRDFMINRFGTPLYKMFFEDYTEKVWGRNPKDIAADWGSQRIKGLSLSKAVLTMLRKTFGGGKEDKNIETSLIDQFIYPKKGPGQLWEIMADEVRKMGGVIQMHTKVVGLHTKDGQVISVDAIGKNENENIMGDLFISTMPIKDLVAGMQPEAPATIREITSKLPYRDFITVGLLVSGLKIKNQTKTPTIGNIVPDCWIYIQERDVKLGRLQIFNNWSPYMVKDIENTVWIGLEYFCNEGEPMWVMPDEEFIRFAADELAKIGIIAKEDVIDGVRINVKKAYPAYFGTYEKFDMARAYLDGFDNLYCIGRNGQHRYNNMDHSMLSAMEAVNVILSNSNDKSSIWNVNTEEEYHETKK